MKTTQLLRTLALSLVILAVIMAVANARDLIISWDANPAEDHVTGYVVTIANGPASREIDVPGATEVHADLVHGDVVTVRAYNDQGMESPPSDSITISAPGKPGGLRVRHTVEIQQSDNLGTWKPLATITTYDSAERQEFYRSKNP